MQLPLELQEKETSQTPSSALHLEEWVRYFRHRYSIKNSLKTKCIQMLLNPSNAFWKDLMLY